MRLLYPITPSREVARPCGDVSISFSDPVLSEDLPVPLLPWLEREPRPPEGRRHQSRVRQLRPQAGRRADLPELRNHLRQGRFILIVNSVLQCFKWCRNLNKCMAKLIKYSIYLIKVNVNLIWQFDVRGHLGLKDPVVSSRAIFN